MKRKADTEVSDKDAKKSKQAPHPDPDIPTSSFDVVLRSMSSKVKIPVQVAHNEGMASHDIKYPPMLKCCSIFKAFETLGSMVKGDYMIISETWRNFDRNSREEVLAQAWAMTREENVPRSTPTSLLRTLKTDTECDDYVWPYLYFEDHATQPETILAHIYHRAIHQPPSFQQHDLDLTFDMQRKPIRSRFAYGLRSCSDDASSTASINAAEASASCTHWCTEDGQARCGLTRNEALLVADTQKSIYIFLLKLCQMLMDCLEQDNLDSSTACSNTVVCEPVADGGMAAFYEKELPKAEPIV